MRATVRGQASPAVPLAEGWQTVQVTLPARRARRGREQDHPRLRQLGTLRRQEGVGGGRVDRRRRALDATAPPQIFDGNGLVVPANGALVYYVMVPSQAARSRTSTRGGCNVKVTRGARPCRRRRRSPTKHRRSRAARRQVARLSSPPTALLRSKSAALTAGGEAPTVKHAPAPKNVVFWMTDDTRSDKFKLYNPKTRVETPVVDAFAKRATRSRSPTCRATSRASRTRSLWTSLYPLKHKFIAEKAKLDPKFVTLPEAIKPTGRTPMGLMANGFIDAFWGFGEGWDLLQEPHPRGRRAQGRGLRRRGRAGAAEARAASRTSSTRHHRRARVVARARAVDRQVRSRAVRRAVRQGVPRSAARQDRRRQDASHRARQDAHHRALRLRRQLQRSAVRRDRSKRSLRARRRHHGHLHRRPRRGAVGPRQDRPRPVAARGAGARAAGDLLPAAVSAGQERSTRASRSSTCYRRSSTRSAARCRPTRRASR